MIFECVGRSRRDRSGSCRASSRTRDRPARRHGGRAARSTPSDRGRSWRQLASLEQLDRARAQDRSGSGRPESPANRASSAVRTAGRDDTRPCSRRGCDRDPEDRRARIAVRAVRRARAAPKRSCGAKLQPPTTASSARPRPDDVVLASSIVAAVGAYSMSSERKPSCENSSKQRSRVAPPYVNACRIELDRHVGADPQQLAALARRSACVRSASRYRFCGIVGGAARAARRASRASRSDRARLSRRYRARP